MLVDKPDNDLPIPSVEADYGFITNCRNKEDAVQLKEAYKTFFEDSNGDPLKLHEACLQGKIYDYVWSTLKLDQTPSSFIRHLMKNPYPLRY